MMTRDLYRCEDCGHPAAIHEWASVPFAEDRIGCVGPNLAGDGICDCSNTADAIESVERDRIRRMLTRDGDRPLAPGEYVETWGK